MRASVVVGPRRSQITELPPPPLGPGDVLVQVKACGVCRSELEEWQNPPRALVLGHEPSGVIAAVGAGVTGLREGQRVTVFTGKSGPYTCYTSGAFAEVVAVAQENVVSLPASLPFELALGEPLACLVSAFERAPIRLSDRVLLLGAGFMGLALLQLVVTRNPRELVVADLSPEARAAALRYGAHRACTPNELMPVRWERDGDAGFDVVIECSGAAPALALAGEVAAAHATIVIVGYHQIRQVDVGLWNVKGLTVINAHEKRRAYFMECMRNGIDMVARGRLDMASLVTHRYGLDELDSAFTDLMRKAPGHTKGVVLMG